MGQEVIRQRRQNNFFKKNGVERAMDLQDNTDMINLMTMKFGMGTFNIQFNITTEPLETMTNSNPYMGAIIITYIGDIIASSTFGGHRPSQEYYNSLVNTLPQLLW